MDSFDHFIPTAESLVAFLTIFTFVAVVLFTGYCVLMVFSLLLNRLSGGPWVTWAKTPNIVRVGVMGLPFAILLILLGIATHNHLWSFPR